MESTVTNEHIVTIVDGSDAGGAPLEFTRRTLEQGGRATLVVLLSERDHDNIEAYAKAENLPPGEAEKRYIEATTVALTDLLGTPSIEAIVGVQAHERWDLADLVMTDMDASTLVLPRHLAQRRPWRTVAKRSRVPVVITPPDGA